MVATTRSKSKQNAYLAFHRLPAEVLLAVIEQLLDDEPSLSSCCLVARSWVSLGRICLFRTVTVHSKKGGPDRFEEFLRFLRRADVGRHVRELTLSAPPLGFDPIQVTPLDEDADDVIYHLCTPCSIDTVWRILDYTHNLCAFNFSYLLFTASAIPKTIPTCRPALDDLAIDNCSASNKDARLFYELLCLFSDIGNLCFICGPWEPVVASTLFEARTSLPLIRKLDMYGDYQATTDGTFELLRRSKSLDGALTQILFETTSPTILPAFFSFLPEAAAHLVNLEMKAFGVFCHRPDGTPYAFRFPLLPALRRLALDVDLGLEDDLSERSSCVRNVINVYSYLLSTPSSFPVLTTFDLCVSSGSLAHQTFVHSAWRTDAWRRFGEALVALPAILIINFDLDNTPETTDTLYQGEVWSPEAMMDDFFKQHVTALWDYYCRFRATAASGQGSNQGGLGTSCEEG
ncbi:hypothetical protein K466DRAFT_563168 [Polyporus arcularius HHB13444]|uniref:F-box domain-containing protein n=1 Tax=Polyporus arcularius HHB13444 TaxID=1314778 RepID=A0A5C3PPR9_9APHY|nr:hypothetical protein K466DRAFT_563168 [Polyporus arcularius HHB13444]